MISATRLLKGINLSMKFMLCGIMFSLLTMFEAGIAYIAIKVHKY